MKKLILYIVLICLVFYAVEYGLDYISSAINTFLDNTIGFDSLFERFSQMR